MASHFNRDKRSFGITLLVFNSLFLLLRFDIFDQIPNEYNFLIISCFSLVIGISFVLIQPKRIASWLLLFTAIFDNSGLFSEWINIYLQLIVSVILIITGLLMILTSRK